MFLLINYNKFSYFITTKKNKDIKNDDDKL
jgi:hypothetical protein